VPCDKVPLRALLIEFSKAKTRGILRFIRRRLKLTARYRVLWKLYSHQGHCITPQKRMHILQSWRRLQHAATNCDAPQHKTLLWGPWQYAHSRNTRSLCVLMKLSWSRHPFGHEAHILSSTYLSSACLANPTVLRKHPVLHIRWGKEGSKATKKDTAMRCRSFHENP